MALIKGWRLILSFAFLGFVLAVRAERAILNDRFDLFNGVIVFISPGVWLLPHSPASDFGGGWTHLLPNAIFNGILWGILGAAVAVLLAKLPRNTAKR
jgi:hypothetical protein